jgi:cytochrome c-type biogenesis protein CcsB
VKINTSLEMLPVYLALLCYGIAFTILLLDTVMTVLSGLVRSSRPASSSSRAWRLASFLYFAGFVSAVVAFAVRWNTLGHVPLQGMFDVFLAMGVAIYPITRFCRRIGGRYEASDMLLGFVLLFPAAFIFSSEPQLLPPALQSFLFAPHVAVYLLAYVILTKAAVHAVCHLVRGQRDDHRVRVVQPDGKVSAVYSGADAEFLAQFGNAHRTSASQVAPPTSTVFRHLPATDTTAFRLVCLGFPLLTLGLFLGSWWGQIAWGDYWGWDPKEMWSLATWLIFVLYFHVRYSWPSYRRLSSLLIILGFVAIVITVLWVNLSHLFAGLHNYAGM